MKRNAKWPKEYCMRVCVRNKTCQAKTFHWE